MAGRRLEEVTRDEVILEVAERLSPYSARGADKAHVNLSFNPRRAPAEFPANPGAPVFPDVVWGDQHMPAGIADVAIWGDDMAERWEAAWCDHWSVATRSLTIVVPYPRLLDAIRVMGHCPEIEWATWRLGAEGEIILSHPSKDRLEIIRDALEGIESS
jgi:hypothetical protein